MTEEPDSTSRLRQRQQRRRQQRTEMVNRPAVPRQTIRADRVRIPQINIPGGRWLLLVPVAILVMLGVILFLGALNPPDPETLPNAIWLDQRWSYTDREPGDIQALAENLRNHRIGSVYVFVSSLKADNTWSGLPDGRNRFTEVDAAVRSFTEQLREASPNLEIYAWIEVIANTADGYRLDQPAVQTAIADFSGRLLANYPFDGLMLDVKPIFTDNEDLLTLLRAIRQTVGVTAPIAAALPPDLTPEGTDLVLPELIAPGTYLDEQYKRRLALQADTLVIRAYNSYLSDQVAYINWVAYQAEAYQAALDNLQNASSVIISVPSYEAQLPAHDPRVESLAGALDGVWLGLTEIMMEQEEIIPVLEGIAIFTDHDLSEPDWNTVREKWTTRQ